MKTLTITYSEDDVTNLIQKDIRKLLKDDILSENLEPFIMNVRYEYGYELAGGERYYFKEAIVEVELEEKVS